MTFLLQSEIEKSYIFKINQQIKILRSSKIDWTIEDVIRFANLIKIDDAVSDIIKSYEIDGNKLFDIEYLSINLEAVITERNFMPFYKLFYIVTAMLQISQGQKQQKNHKERTSQLKNIQNAWIIDIDEYLIIKIKQQLVKLNEIKVIQLGSSQLSRILKNLSMLAEGQLIKKWNIDGFSLICIIGNEEQKHQTYKNYFSEEEIKLLVKLSTVFLHIYYYQSSLESQKLNDIDQVRSFQIIDINFNDGETNTKKSIIKSQFGISQYGCSQEGDYKNEDLFIKENGYVRTSQYDISIGGDSYKQDLRNSEYVQSMQGQLRKSEYGVSQRGSIKNSEYNVSERGSLAQSMAESMTESMYMSNSIFDQQLTKNLSKDSQTKTITKSSIEDEKTLKSLMEATLNLPFNLLDLEPLCKIKISVISYPFNIIKGSSSSKKEIISTNEILSSESSSQKAYSIYDIIDESENIRQFKVFNLSGCKFGRNPQNDFNFPDELSISGKHAQIVFKDESYYIRDLGSKTGTFLYISQRKPLILMDEQIVQLSYEVQFKVVIVKNDINEGVIKFQFKKPQNEPPYRAILKNNNTVRIGKSQKSHIKLLNQSISSNHAEIKYEEGKFIMYDCNTRTGTWLRLSSRGVRSVDKKLSKDDIIRISSKKTFFIEDISESIQVNFL